MLDRYGHRNENFVLVVFGTVCHHGVMEPGCPKETRDSGLGLPCSTAFRGCVVFVFF